MSENEGSKLTGADGDDCRRVPRRWTSLPPSPARRPRRALPPGVMRNLGLVIALVLLCIVGIITAGERFASTDNVLTILRLASVIGVVSIGMTFVITAGGIDLSVGAVVGLVLGVGDHSPEPNCSPPTCTGSSWSPRRCWSAQRPA